MKQKLKTIEIGSRIFEIEREFSRKGVINPIIRFEKYNDKNKEDIYIDEKTGKKIKISVVKKIIHCEICEKRLEVFNKLKREVEKSGGEFIEEWNREKEKYLAKLKECPACSKRVSSVVSDLNSHTHTHYCQECNLHFPKEEGVVFAGDYEDDSLERK